MNFRAIDHLVLNATDVERTADFFSRLGFEVRRGEQRCELLAGAFKINVHTAATALHPKALRPVSGNADFCIEIDNKIADFVRHLNEVGIAVEEGPVERHGARGAMQSVYVRDPDGNLIEFASYEAD